MKLKKYLENLDPDRIVSIGGNNGSAYAYVGRAGDIDRIDKHFSDYFDNANRLKDKYYKQCVTRVMCNISPTEDPFDKAKSIYKAYVAYKYICDYIESYIPIMKRNIVKHYEKITEDCTAIIVTGSENGNYWDKEEYDKCHL